MRVGVKWNVDLTTFGGFRYRCPVKCRAYLTGVNLYPVKFEDYLTGAV